MSYLSGRAGAAAPFGSRVWPPERHQSLQPAAAGVGGDTPPECEETSALWLRLLTPAPLSRPSLTDVRWKVGPTGHIPVWTEADWREHDKQEVRIVSTLAACW